MSCTTQTSATRRITVVLRYDDYSAKSPLELETQIFDIVHQQGLTLTVGVIPYICEGDVHDPSSQTLLPLDETRGAVLREAIAQGSIEVGLHGYSHQTSSAQSMSEFTGLDYADQVERMTQGKALLEELTGTPVTMFIPPWNAYDLNTLRALDTVGFSILSAGVGGAISPDSSLSFVPATCYPETLRDLIAKVRASDDPAPAIVVLFHCYNFVEQAPYRGILSLDEFADLLAWLKSQDDIQILSVAQAAATHQFDAARYQRDRTDLALSEALPPYWQVQVADNGFLPSNSLRWQIILRLVCLYSALLFIGAILFFATQRFLLGKARTLSRVFAWVTTGATIGILAYMLRDLQINWRGAVATSLTLGACAGLWLAYLVRGRRDYAK